ncbi:MAG: DUF6141 family protein [Acidimicrobiia bacterium]|nr:DUF6141 family protein [Acidimicrobiia bacterium]
MIFEERQRFRQWWAWGAILLPALIAWILFALQILGGEPVGDDPMPDWAVWVFFVVMGLGFPVWFAVLTLETTVDEEGVRVRFRNGIGRRDLDFGEIARVEVRTYRPLLEFGGWGLRWGGKGRRAFTASGNRGVDVALHDGRSVLIGSKRPEALAEAIRSRIVA